jgi:4-alpha-glucanotransferase
VAAEKARALEYLAADGREMNWTLIRALLASVADTAIVPMQDVLGLGSEARMNTPATLGGNWRWRLRGDALAPAPAARLARMVELYGR